MSRLLAALVFVSSPTLAQQPRAIDFPLCVQRTKDVNFCRTMHSLTVRHACVARQLARLEASRVRNPAWKAARLCDRSPALDTAPLDAAAAAINGLETARTLQGLEDAIRFAPGY